MKRTLSMALAALLILLALIPCWVHLRRKEARRHV